MTDLSAKHATAVLKSGFTRLHRAVWEGRWADVSALIAAGADPMVPGGSMPERWARRHGEVLALRVGLELNETQWRKAPTPLTLAVFSQSSRTGLEALERLRQSPQWATAVAQLSAAQCRTVWAAVAINITRTSALVPWLLAQGLTPERGWADAPSKHRGQLYWTLREEERVAIRTAVPMERLECLGTPLACQVPFRWHSHTHHWAELRAHVHAGGVLPATRATEALAEMIHPWFDRAQDDERDTHRRFLLEHGAQWWGMEGVAQTPALALAEHLRPLSPHEQAVVAWWQARHPHEKGHALPGAYGLTVFAAVVGREAFGAQHWEGSLFERPPVARVMQHWETVDDQQPEAGGLRELLGQVLNPPQRPFLETTTSRWDALLRHSARWLDLFLATGLSDTGVEKGQAQSVSARWKACVQDMPQGPWGHYAFAPLTASQQAQLVAVFAQWHRVPGLDLWGQQAGSWSLDELNALPLEGGGLSPLLKQAQDQGAHWSDEAWHTAFEARLNTIGHALRRHHPHCEATQRELRYWLSQPALAQAYPWEAWMGQSWYSAQLEIAQACLPTDRRAPSPSALRQVFESRMERLFAQATTRVHRQQLPSDARLVDEVSFFTGHADASGLMTQPLGPQQHAFPHYAFQLLLSEPSPDSWTAIEALFHLGVDAWALGLGFEQALSAQSSALNTAFWARNQAFVDARVVTEALEDVGATPARRRLRL